jgi:hypothetical protein
LGWIGLGSDASDWLDQSSMQKSHGTQRFLSLVAAQGITILLGVLRCNMTVSTVPVVRHGQSDPGAMPG